MRSPTKRVADFLASPRLAATLLAATTIIVFVATLVPQHSRSSTVEITAWAAEHTSLEHIVRVLGFHDAYASPLFLLVVTFLLASTCVCSWRRTRVAAARLRTVTGMSEESVRARAAKPSFVVPAEKNRVKEHLQAIGGLLRRQRLRVTLGDEYVGAGGGLPGLLGSPVFHWSLVAIFAALLAGQLVRTGGLLGITEGEVVPHAASSYGVLTKGPLYEWPGTFSAIGVDSVDLDNTIGGIDRGATPRVVLYGPNHEVLARGDVYPNHPLRYKSVIVHPNNYGLAPVVSLVSTSGLVIARTSALADFATGEASRTAPSTLDLMDEAGAVFRVTLTVPLDKVGGQFVERIPSHPRATVVIESTDGRRIAERDLAVGQEVRLPGGSGLRLDAVRYYARLSVYDDRSLPALFLAICVGLLGLSASLLGQKRAVAIVAVDDSEGTHLAVWYRDWRRGSSGCHEFEELVRALVLGPTDERE
jgi:hypothetical protein